MSVPSNLPAWLKAALTPAHLEAVLGTLAGRETTRELARNASRGQYQSIYPRAGPSTSDSATQISSSDAAHYSVSFGNHPDNQIYNRYLDMEPYDRTRVNVGEVEAYPTLGCDDDEGCRYINANWVRELFGGKWWIATQAPLPQTTHIYLTLLVQSVTNPPPHVFPFPDPQSTRKSRIRTVVQLTPNLEHGRRKAHIYFPDVVGQSHFVVPEPGSMIPMPMLKVTLLESRTVSEAQCVISTVSISCIGSAGDKEPVVFRHLLYGAWPDHGVPQRQDRVGFLEFVRLVDRTNKDTSLIAHSDDVELDPDPPIMVNCSAGVGRTGAFIALSSVLRAHGLLSTPPTNNPSSIHTATLPELYPSPLGPLPETIREDLVAQEIDSLREQRPSMVQRDEQIFLIYDVLANAILR